MKKILCVLAAFAALSGGAADANKIRSVIAVDFLHVEVVMADALTAKETDPFAWEDAFRFNEGVTVTGAPREVDVRGYPHTYRIPVAGLDEDVIYQISYRGQKPKTFKIYDEEEMDRRYKNRYGDYF